MRRTRFSSAYSRQLARPEGLAGVSKGSDPAAAPEEVELDRDRDQHGANANGKDYVWLFHDRDEVREVHAVETGQELRGKKRLAITVRAFVVVLRRFETVDR